MGSLLYQYSAFESPHESSPERLGFCEEFLQTLFYSPLVGIKKHSWTSQSRALHLNTPEMKYDVQNPSLSSNSTISQRLAWGRTGQRRICPVCGLVLKTGLNPGHSLSAHSKILLILQLRPQLSVAIPPSRGGEWDSTWRGEQTPGSDTAPKDSKFAWIRGRRKRRRKIKIPPELFVVSF